jgi:AcrR family transcriptional regulator
VIASAELRAPVDETIDWLRERLAGIVEEGKEQGQFAPSLDAEEIAATILATVQGGYVLARASGSPAAFDTAVRGLLALLSPTRRGLD